MISDNRARLTVPDILFVLMSFGFLLALWPVFQDGFEKNVGLMGPGAAILWQMILPYALLILLYVIFSKATRGAT